MGVFNFFDLAMNIDLDLELDLDTDMYLDLDIVLADVSLVDKDPNYISIGDRQI